MHSQVMYILFIVMISGYGFGALTALLGLWRRPGRAFTAIGTVAGAAAGLTLGMAIFHTGSPFSISIPSLLPVAGGMALRLDGLGAFFLTLIGLSAIPAAIYGPGYSAIYENRRGWVRLLGVMFNLFLLSMRLVTMADNTLIFLLMWEAMSLTSYFLVVTEANEEGTVRAGVWYVAMTHAGLATLLVAFMLLSNGGAGAFADLRAGASALSPGGRNLIFRVGLVRLRLEGGGGCAARVGAAGARGGAGVRVGSVDGRDDEVGGVRSVARLALAPRRWASVVGRSHAGGRRDFGAGRGGIRPP